MFFRPLVTLSQVLAKSAFMLLGKKHIFLFFRGIVIGPYFLYRYGMTHNKRDIIRDYIRLPNNDDLLLRRAKP